MGFGSHCQWKKRTDQVILVKSTILICGLYGCVYIYIQTVRT